MLTLDSNRSKQKHWPFIIALCSFSIYTFPRIAFLLSPFTGMSAPNEEDFFAIPYVVQSKDIMPIEATFALPYNPPAEPEQPLTRERRATVSSEKTGSTGSENSTPPLNAIEDAYPDGGLRAWLVVLGCFLYACTVFGFGLNWGVLQDYYHTTMFPSTSLGVFTVIAGLANFVSGHLSIKGPID